MQSLVLVSNPMTFLYGSLPIQASAAALIIEKFFASQVLVGRHHSFVTGVPMVLSANRWNFPSFVSSCYYIVRSSDCLAGAEKSYKRSILRSVLVPCISYFPSWNPILNRNHRCFLTCLPPLPALIRLQTMALGSPILPCRSTAERCWTSSIACI